jgi:hypothetical protein
LKSELGEKNGQFIATRAAACGTAGDKVHEETMGGIGKGSK